MDIEIKKDLVSNWFKLLQDAICDDISRLEKNKIKFKSTTWQRSKKKDEGGGEYRIIKNRLKIPMNSQVRSLNIASSVAIVLAESLRQIELI